MKRCSAAQLTKEQVLASSCIVSTANPFENSLSSSPESRF